MSRLAHVVAALLAALALAVALPTAAAAQDEDQTETAETETVGDEGTGDDADEPDDDDALLALGVLLFGALALGGTLLYMDRWRQSSATLFEKTLATTGVVPDVKPIPAMVSEEGVRGRAAAAAAEITIEGPAVVYVGRGARFRALRDGEAVEAEWSVEPADAAQAEPARADQTTVTASRRGQLKVQATVEGATAEAYPVGMPAPRGARRGAIPFVGAGYGGITISIIALTLAAAATVYGRLDGAALIAFAAAIVGYFFVEARGEQSAGAGDGGTPVAGEGEGGGGEEGP